MSHVRSTTVSRPADTGRGPGSVANGKRIFILVLMLLAVGSITGCLQSSSPMMGNVTGKVFDSNGHVLKGATVEIYGGNHKVSTDELGRYTITGVEPGEKRIVATYQGRSVVINVNIIRGETLENADLTFAVIDGIPPVITDVAVGSLTENVADGVSGFVVPRREPAALATALDRLAADTALRAQMGAAGRERVQTCFRPEAQIAAFDRFFRDVGRDHAR